MVKTAIQVKSSAVTFSSSESKDTIEIILFITLRKTQTVSMTWIQSTQCTEGWEGDFASVMKWHMLEFKSWQIWCQMKAWNPTDTDLIKCFSNF